MSQTPFIPIEGQYFTSEQDWINRASRVLTAHPDYFNAENAERLGWRGSHFTALCFDQKGRRCRNGRDFRIAKEEGAYPVWWIWPDQIVDLILVARTERDFDPAHQYTVGEETMARVFRAANLTNLSDMQAVLDAVEAALVALKPRVATDYEAFLQNENATLREILRQAGLGDHLADVGKMAVSNG